MATDHPGTARSANVVAARLVRTDGPSASEPPTGARSWEAAVDWYFSHLDLIKQLQREQATQQARPPTPVTAMPDSVPGPPSPVCYTTATLVPVSPALGRDRPGRSVTSLVFLGPVPAAEEIPAREGSRESSGTARHSAPDEAVSPPMPNATVILEECRSGNNRPPQAEPDARPGPRTSDAPPPAEPVRRLRLTPAAELRATEGQHFTALAGRFTDPRAEDVTAYRAVIDWGDGCHSNGVVTANAGGRFDVTGSQTFALAGSYTVTVTVRGPAGMTAEATLPATVADAPLSAGGKRFDVPAGAAFTRVVGTFTDANLRSLAEDHGAVIDWGDGTSAAGAITAGGRGRFDVSGSHAYARGGVYAVTITIDSKGGAAATARSTASVRAELTFVRGPLPIAATAGVRTGKQVLAAFTDVAPDSRSSAYTVLIAWGDGGTTMGLVTARPGEYEITGSHLYAQVGAYTVGITIERRGAPPITGVTTATVEG
jgi:hypothetical protein